jgi:hypothetical protein
MIRVFEIKIKLYTELVRATIWSRARHSSAAMDLYPPSIKFTLLDM